MFNVIKLCNGVYITRYSGSSFKERCLFFIKAKEVDKVLKKIEKYISIYPKIKEKYSAHICKTAGEIKL